MQFKIQLQRVQRLRGETKHGASRERKATSIATVNRFCKRADKSLLIQGATTVKHRERQTVLQGQ